MTCGPTFEVPNSKVTASRRTSFALPARPFVSARFSQLSTGEKNLASDMPPLTTHSGCINGCSAHWRSVPLGHTSEPGSGPCASR